MRHLRYGIITFLLLLTFSGLSGCSSDSEHTTFWIVTEDTGQYGMNDITKLLMKEFQRLHENMEFKMDILPTEQKERESKLEQLRVEIMSGKGPDIYLLPSSSYPGESLLRDVNQSMHNGFFTDISEYYDADETLEKESLKKAVMDAGVIDGARYVLPLRFDMPAFYIDKTAIGETGINLAVFEQGINYVYEEIQRLDSHILACGAELNDRKFGLNVYPNLIDYEKSSVLLSEEEVTAFFENYQKNMVLAGDAYEQREVVDIPSYIVNGLYWGNSDFPMISCGITMDEAMQLAVFGKIEEKELLMFPMRATDGSVIAEVTYWSAVGANCENPALAYEFLSMFLSEEAQWETNTAKMYKESPTLVGSGWPVRTHGSAEPLWDIYRDQYEGMFWNGEDGWRVRNSKIMKSQITDQDIPLLDVEIDFAQFTTDFEMQVYTQILFELNDAFHGTNTEMDLRGTVEALIEQLKWHVSEG